MTYNPNITNFIAGDIVRIGAGHVDWEVVGPARDAGFLLLKSGMSGRHVKVRASHLRAWTREYARR